MANPESLILPPPLATKTKLQAAIDEYIPGEFEIDESGKLLKKYITYEGFLSYLDQGCDTWIKKVIPEQLMARSIDLGERGIVKFTSPYLEKPMLSMSGANPMPLWPKVARDRGLDYSGGLYVNLSLISPQGVEVERVDKILIGMIPIMLGSEFDNLYGLSDAELLAKGECPSDPKHYFIARGNEKVILLHEKISALRNLIYLSKEEVISTITNETTKGSTITTIARDKSNILKLRFSYLGKNSNINLLSVYKLFGLSDPEEILKLILSFTKDKWASKVLSKLAVTLSAYQDIGDAVRYISKIRAANRKKEEEKGKKVTLSHEEEREEILALFRRELFPQVSPDPSNDKRRLDMLSQMAVRLLEYMAGFRKLDRLDEWGNKRLDAAAESMKQLFQSLFDKMVYEVEKEIHGKKVATLKAISQKIKASIITDGFSSSLHTQNWGIKNVYKKNIVDIMDSANLLASYSHLTRVRVTGQEKSKAKEIRLVQPTASCLICPAETPERKGCGIIKNVAITTVITVRDPQIDPLITQLIAPFISINKTEASKSKCWFNGVFYGWCEGEMLRDMLITARREQNTIPMTTSIVLDKDDILHISTTSSRVARPLLVFQDNELVIEAKGLWGADFSTLLEEGAVEYIDAFEQDYGVNIYIAPSLDAVRDIKRMIEDTWQAIAKSYAQLSLVEGKEELPEELEGSFTPEEFQLIIDQQRQEVLPSIESIQEELRASKTALLTLIDKSSYSHCELDPSAVWGFAASVIPFPDRNAAARNSFQCHMGQQSLGIIHSQQQHRFPTGAKRLAFPSRSVFGTQMADELGFNELPTGQTVTIALILDKFTQEDSFVVNEAALQRGLFRYTKEFSKSAVEKKEGDVEEKIRRPEVKKGEPQQRYINLDERGIIRIGSIVKPHDAIIGRVRHNTKLGQTENATIFAGEYEQGIVDEVFITKSREGRMIVNVRIVDTRIPKRGDKLALRPSQKGTIGLVVPEIDMPRTASGVVPDIVMNPLAFPSRMTMGTIIEIFASKVAVMTGNRVNASAFRPFDINSFMETLKELGFERTGQEEMYSGITGEPFQATVFTGISYVQKLKHDAEDKIQARARGNVMPLTHQPTKSRKRGGGQKIGEMEATAFMSHGAAGIIQEKLCESSDATPIVFCSTCGTIAIANHVDMKYECRLCGDKGNFGRATIPYVQKLLDQYLYGINIGMRYKFIEAETI